MTTKTVKFGDLPIGGRFLAATGEIIKKIDAFHGTYTSGVLAGQTFAYGTEREVSLPEEEEGTSHLETLAALLSWCQREIEKVDDLIREARHDMRIKLEGYGECATSIYLPIHPNDRDCPGGSDMPRLLEARFDLGTAVFKTVQAYREHLLLQIRRLAMAINSIPVEKPETQTST